MWLYVGSCQDFCALTFEQLGAGGNCGTFAEIGLSEFAGRYVMATAGERLRAQLDAAMDRERAQLGQPALEWDEREQQHIDAACRAADAVELLEERIAAERSGEDRASIIVKCLAERRLQDDKCSEHLKYLQLDQFTPLKNPHRVAGGHARWDGVQRGRKGTA